MVAGTTAARTARTSTPRLSKPAPSKAAYKPRIQFVSANAYALPSESYGGHILYLVTVLGPGVAICECTGYTYRKTCKHSVLALAAHAYRAHPSHLQSAAALPEKESDLGVRVASTGPGYEVYSLRTGALICTVDDPAQAGLPTPRRAPAFIPAPAEFAELFAA